MSSLSRLALVAMLALPPMWEAPGPSSQAASAVFVCPPCSGGCDDQTFDHPGSCPICGMALVEKTAGSGGSSGGGTGAAGVEKTRNVAILLFDGVQIIDYTAPWEVFGHARMGDRAAFSIYSVAEKSEPLTTSMGMRVTPKYSFADAPKADVLVLPGGNVEPSLAKPEVMEWVRGQARDAEVVLSVCNGAFFLARAGLLDGLEATTFAHLIPELQKAAPKARVVSDKRFVDNGKIVTSAGLSSGIDGSLHVIEKLLGHGQAQVVATALEYHWQPESKWARAMLADKHLSTAYDWVHGHPRSVVKHEGTNERWETQWKLSSEKSAPELLDNLSGALESEGKWIRDAGAASSKTGAARSWRFRDADQSAWRGSVRITPASAGQYVLTVEVERAAARQAAAPPSSSRRSL